MESALSLLLWGGLFFLMMRFGCGSHAGHGRGAGNNKVASAEGHGGCGGTGSGKQPRPPAGAERLTWKAPEKDLDPVCGKTVSTADARTSLHDGQVYYFCSRECREAFEVLPGDYVGLGEPHPVRRLGHTPVEGENHVSHRPS